MSILRAILIALLGLASRAADAPPLLPLLPLVIKGQFFELELAATPATRERGLMERPEVAADRGMLFVFTEEAPRRFWMKHTLIDLEIVYLDHAGRVVSVAAMRAEPPRGERETEAQYEDRLPFYPSGGPASFAIEFRSGTLALLQLAPGDVLDLNSEYLRSLAK